MQKELDACSKKLEKMLSLLPEIRLAASENYKDLLNRYLYDLEFMSENFTLFTRSLPSLLEVKDSAKLSDTAIEKAWNIDIKYTDEGWFFVKIPALLPKKKGGAEVIKRPLQMAMNQFFIKQTQRKVYKTAVICFKNVYPSDYPQKCFYDNDNIETQSVINIISDYVLPDDSPEVLNHYFCSAVGSQSATEIYVVPREDFFSWIESNSSA